MDSDIQEAESHKYSNDISIILKLSSSKYALFGPNRKLYGIYQDWFDLEEAISNPQYEEWKAKQVWKSPAIQYDDVLSEVKVDIGDLGI